MLAWVSCGVSNTGFGPTGVVPRGMVFCLYSPRIASNGTAEQLVSDTPTRFPGDEEVQPPFLLHLLEKKVFALNTCAGRWFLVS